MRLKSLAWTAALGTSLVALTALGTGVSQAAIAPPPTTSYPIYWGDTDGTLSVQSAPYVNNVIGTLTEATNNVDIICQTIKGGPDTYDGFLSTTWDEIWFAGRTGFVYDHFIETPPQPLQGGYSQGQNSLGQGPPPVCPGG
jgi:hypothetical protein